MSLRGEVVPRNGVRRWLVHHPIHPMAWCRGSPSQRRYVLSITVFLGILFVFIVVGTVHVPFRSATAPHQVKKLHAPTHDWWKETESRHGLRSGVQHHPEPGSTSFDRAPTQTAQRQASRLRTAVLTPPDSVPANTARFAMYKGMQALETYAHEYGMVIERDAWVDAPEKVQRVTTVVASVEFDSGPICVVGFRDGHMAVAALSVAVRQRTMRNASFDINLLAFDMQYTGSGSVARGFLMAGFDDVDSHVVLIGREGHETASVSTYLREKQKQSCCVVLVSGESVEAAEDDSMGAILRALYRTSRQGVTPIIFLTRTQETQAAWAHEVPCCSCKHACQRLLRAWSQVVQTRLQLDVGAAFVGRFSPQADLYKAHLRDLETSCGAACHTSPAGNVLVPRLGFAHKRFDCVRLWGDDVMDEWGWAWPPPAHIPAVMRSAFSRNDTIRLVQGRFSMSRGLDKAGKRRDMHSRWTKNRIDGLIREVERGTLHRQHGGQSVKKLLAGLKAAVATWKRHNHGALQVLVLHSEKPFVEALVLAVAGPRTQIVSLRLEHVASFHPQISTMTMAQARFKFSSGALPRFHIVVAFNTVSWMGLGRLGEALHPWGDLQLMARAWCVARPHAILVLGVPIQPKKKGRGVVKFNEKRKYDAHMLWELTANWKLASALGGNSPKIFVFERADVGSVGVVDTVDAPAVG